MTTSPYTPALEARRVTVELNYRQVLTGVDLAVAPGEIVVVMGANGAGKTTLLRCLAGLRRPTSGSVLWFGQAPRQHLRQKRSVGLLAHHRALYGELTARENLEFAAELCGISDAAAAGEHWLAEAGLQRHAHLPARRLSHGLQQRLALCRALIHDPPLVLLDEPSAGLDQLSQDWVRTLLLRLKLRQRAICLTTHDFSFAQGVADRIDCLQGGRIAVPEQTGAEAA